MAYTYNELSEEAKENAKEQYLYDSDRSYVFYEDIKNYLDEEFPNSELDVQFSLSSRQGDGLNIYGSVAIEDALKISTSSNDIKEKIEEFALINGLYIELTENSRYTYSCKFMDIEDINKYSDVFENWSDWLFDPYLFDDEDEYDTWFENFWNKYAKPFILNVYNQFEELDGKFEKDGYDYLYEISDEEMSDLSDINMWEFDEDGNFI